MPLRVVPSARTGYVITLALVGACAASAAARAQTARATGATTIGSEARARVVDSLTRTIERLYPAADTGRAIAAYLRRRAAAGAYRTAADPRLFVRLLTQDLQATNEDTHLFVDVAGAPQGGAPPPAGHGVEHIERLDGNVGYLRMSHFLGGPDADSAVVTALRYLASTDAILLDLRNSRGGSAALANLVISHFAPRDTVHSLTVYDRARDATIERYTLGSVPGPRRPGVPLFVLVDDVTRSAAEDVPFVLQNMKRATIVGTRTAGAGRNNTFVPLGDGLVASVSFTRVFDPRTHHEWERSGVVPDVRVAADSALPVAHALALDAIVARTTDAARKAELARIAETVRAALRPTALAPAQLARFVGTYEGGQYVTVADGVLVYQPRVAQPRVTLVPLGGGTFASGSARYVFEGAGGATRLRIETADGAATSYPRTSASVPPRRR
jgi:hypothetical protein